MRQRKRPDWAPQAACRGTNVDLYTEKQNKTTREHLREVCATCPVIQECLNWMIVHDNQAFGGGHTKDEISAMRKNQLATLGYSAYENGWLEEDNLLTFKMLEEFESMKVQKERLKRRRREAQRQARDAVEIHVPDLSDLSISINF